MYITTYIESRALYRTIIHVVGKRMVPWWGCAVGAGALAACASLASKLGVLSVFVVSSAAQIMMFSAALRRSNSLRATSVSLATNLVLSACLGRFLLDEVVSWRYTLGLGLTVMGAILVQKRQKTKAL